METWTRQPASAGPGVEDELDREGVSARLRIILVAILVASFVVAPVGYANGSPEALWTAVVGGIVSAIVFVLDRRGRVETAVPALLVPMVAAVTAAMVSGEGIHDAGMILYPMIVVVGSMLLRPWAYVVLVAAVVASVSLVYALGRAGIVAERFRDLTDLSDLVSIVTVLVIQAVAVEVLALGLFRSVREARRESRERRVAEEEVRRLNAELEKRVEARTADLAAANEELEAFSYSVSHDLRTPLRAIGSYASILDQDYATAWEPQARHLLERIRASNSRMNLLIDQLLAFSRLGRRPLSRELVDMDAVARRVVDVLAASAPERSVEWVIGPLPRAWADPVLIEQVMQNLIGNAFKYTSHSPRARIEVGYEARGRESGYFVRDDGVGFDMAGADRLFGVFERLHRDDEFEGSGIGLATVARILKRHGGDVKGSSEPGKGATFVFRLPPVPASVAA